MSCVKDEFDDADSARLAGRSVSARVGDLRSFSVYRCTESHHRDEYGVGSWHWGHPLTEHAPRPRLRTKIKRYRSRTFRRP